MLIQSYPENYETARLRMRPLDLDDTVKWRVFVSDPKCMEFFPNSMKGKPELQSLAWIEKQINRYRDHQGGLMALIDKSSGEFVGQCGLIVQEVDGAEELEVGYSLLPDYWGKGYATEAAIFFKELAFKITEVDSVVSNIALQNIASQHVAERNGMKREKQAVWHGLDIYTYRLKKPVTF